MSKKSLFSDKRLWRAVLKGCDPDFWQKISEIYRKKQEIMQVIQEIGVSDLAWFQTISPEERKAWDQLLKEKLDSHKAASERIRAEIASVLDPVIEALPTLPANLQAAFDLIREDFSVPKAIQFFQDLRSYLEHPPINQETQAGSKQKGKQAPVKGAGRPRQWDAETDAKIYDDWQVAKRQGADRKTFARSKGKTVLELRRLLDREHKRREKQSE